MADGLSILVEPDAATEAGAARRIIAYAVSAAVFIASIWYIYGTFKWAEMWQVLKQVRLAMLVLGGGGSIIVYWMLRALRWHLLLRQTDTRVPLVDLYLCTAVALSFALFTPMQSGEMLKVELLKKHGLMARSPGYGSFLVEKVLDLGTVVAIACVSLLTTLNLFPAGYAYGILAVLAAVCVAGVLVVRRLQLKGRPQRLLDSMKQCVGDGWTLWWVLLITLASWACCAWSWQVFLFSAGLKIEFAKALAVMSIVALLSLVSLIPGGLGINEASTAHLLARLGYSVAQSQVGAVVLRACSIVAVLLGCFHIAVWSMVSARNKARAIASNTGDLARGIPGRVCYATDRQ